MESPPREDGGGGGAGGSFIGPWETLNFHQPQEA